MSEVLNVPTMAEMMAQGKQPEVLFWVGCAGSFDDRAKKITKAIVKILNHANVKFAVLGTEESCTGDPAKRAGNEFLFQMQAMTNITVMNEYKVKRIVTGSACLGNQPAQLRLLEHLVRSAHQMNVGLRDLLRRRRLEADQVEDPVVINRRAAAIARQQRRGDAKHHAGIAQERDR